MTDCATAEAPLRKRTRVTPIRYFSGRLSGSRNVDYEISRDPNRCHWCEKKFRSCQTRYPIKTDITERGDWGLVSVCMDCFKKASKSETSHQERYRRECRGCGEPLLIPAYWCDVCSSRCYQRQHRKYKRRWLKCKACKKPFKPARNDAQFCSGKCRQFHYRARKLNCAAASAEEGP